MAIGKAGVTLHLDKLSVKFGEINIVQNGKLASNYNESETAEYEKDTIDINIDIMSGSKFYILYNGFHKKIY